MTAPFLLLNRWALHRTVGTEHTAVTRLRPQYRTAVATLVVELASVRRHDFFPCEATVRASNDRFKLNFAHGRWTFSSTRLLPVRRTAAVSMRPNRDGSPREFQKRDFGTDSDVWRRAQDRDGSVRAGYARAVG